MVDSDILNYSVDVIGAKSFTYQKDNIKKMYNTDFPDCIIIDIDMAKSEQDSLKARCQEEGQTFSNVSHQIALSFATNTYGYSAEDTIRELLYQHTSYSEAISLTSVPIYYIDVNNRITVEDEISDIYGDYIINSISLPLGIQGTMNISASRAMERI